jgi:chromosomal replication initiation ATPase DnaA
MIGDRERRLALVRVLAVQHGLTLQEVMGNARKQPAARVRQIAMQRLASEFGDSLTDIGRFFGRHHTTVRHAILQPPLEPWQPRRKIVDNTLPENAG